MPKSPVLDRTIFYDTLNDGTLRLLEWNLVNTTLGQMIEPRNLSSVGIGASRVVQIDEKDLVNFNRILPFDEDQFFATFLTGGQQLPRDYNA